MGNKFVFSILALFITFSLMFTGCASSTDSDNGTLVRLEEVMSVYPDFTGSVLVAKDDEILLSKGYGKADYDKKIDNTPQSIFGIASITSQFTAAAVMMLQEKKLLNLQDTVNKFIEDYPDGDKIKICHLLTHTSGIPEYYSFVDSIEKGKHTYTPSELIDIFKSKPLNFDAGTSFEFSNSNYALLGYIIEKVSGMKYEDYIKQNIFEPLGMDNSSFSGDVSSKDSNVTKALGYEEPETNTNEYSEETTAETEAAYKKAIEAEPTLTYSSGGIYSTVEDLYKWSNAFKTEILLSKASIKEMFTPHSESYGYGWFIDTNDEQSSASTTGNNPGNTEAGAVSTDAAGGSSQIVHHGGYLPGYSSFIIRDNTKNYVAVILSNKQHEESVMDLGYDLLDVLEN
ncbi:CubicO group peptidase (beta-lactamase class C family) [Ruminiclostridium sufflavum DSM 19573]|uniref:CubicO group peptidase (Beta-lactamase class C family) n=1 Tax=Ruminiclostridium sufflavum DSM 19573 TaxID=1121337 RepID=A0A318XH04_9FIRM|nr:serine hydrolase domain-containing protein [Ruminiclostridium sufflavum]PYG85830.1 CubicO group peptidase (beta-lactamase class C family) [Ruminiclostridium sufflavum DSM 19573]